jgi:hypothetical protein
VGQLAADREVAGGARRLEHRNFLTREPPVNDNEVLATGVLYVNPQHEWRLSIQNGWRRRKDPSRKALRE